jgi:2-succinyl-5-enolpyruvyl-6-hydroxy-3-cyclohexene-1-carboxylate synthase
MAEELSQNARLAAAVIEAAIQSSVGEWVVCSGARNLPLVETLMAMPERRRGKVWNFFEERAAAFFALGLSKNLVGRVAVITTSGTAAAELLPATIEAHYSGQPLLLITADRPPEFRGSGAPQAIEQMDLLKPYAWRVVDWNSAGDGVQVAEFGHNDRPEHWNICLAEPLPGEIVLNVPASVHDTDFERMRAEENLGGTLDQCFEVERFCRSKAERAGLLVLLGELSLDERALVETALEKLGAPIWAEASSGLRESEILRSQLIRDGEKSLAAFEPKRVLRIGGVPSLRFWRDLEERTEIDVMSLTRTGFSGLARESEVQVGVGAIAPWLIGETGNRSARVENSRSDFLEALLRKFPASEPALFRRLSELIDSEALVFLGNSLPIREWNLAASFDIPHAYCAANRGANGIDGQVSTFLGMTADAENSPAGAWGIFGDLTAMYDLSAPWVLPQLAGNCKRRIVVINNGGGRIFDRLPAVRDASEEQVAVIRNGHKHDFGHWASMWAMGYACWSAADAWIEPEEATAVIEARPDESQTTDFWREWDAIQ